ncbi:mCG1043521, partial [Mus musculus]
SVGYLINKSINRFGKRGSPVIFYGKSKIYANVDRWCLLSQFKMTKCIISKAQRGKRLYVGVL